MPRLSPTLARRVAFSVAALACYAGLTVWATTSAWAHPGNLIAGRTTTALTAIGDWFIWDIHESIIIGTLSLAAAYSWALLRWHRRLGLSGEAASRSQKVYFFGSLALMYLSLDGPLHHLADELLFSAHMLQHMVLQLMWAPLLVLGVPKWLWQALYDLRGAGAFARFVTRPWPALLLFQAAMWGWHFPQLYNLALEVHAWHIVEHLCFMVTAVIFWFVVVAPLPHLARSLPKRLVFIGLNMTAMKTLGLILTMSSELIYTFYATAPRVLGIDVMSDQQVGGMIMWMPGGGLMWFGVGRVFWLWVNKGTPQRGLTGIAHLDRKRAAQLGISEATISAGDQPGLAPDDQPGTAANG
ncbi:MAG: cytochrome c oxidase assembly protein [Myxococcales bacterium]|nr:cytochrome c oxidase assembly protein [Myxococcales bacterium]